MKSDTPLPSQAVSKDQDIDGEALFGEGFFYLSNDKLSSVNTVKNILNGL